LSRDVQSGHRLRLDDVDEGRAVLRVLVLDGQLQRRRRPPQPPRRDDGGGVARSVRQVRDLSEAHGLELSGVLGGKLGLQLRLLRVVYARAAEGWEGRVQLPGRPGLYV